MTMSGDNNIRTNIKKLANILRAFDRSPIERNRTRRLTAKLWGPFEKWSCALCGRRKPVVRYIARAHIAPLEEGGTSPEDNLILLCERKRSLSGVVTNIFESYTKNVELSISGLTLGKAIREVLDSGSDIVGCHKLFDDGLISRKEIRSIRLRLTDVDKGEWGSFENRPVAKVAFWFAARGSVC